MHSLQHTQVRTGTPGVRTPGRIVGSLAVSWPRPPSVSQPKPPCRSARARPCAPCPDPLRALPRASAIRAVRVTGPSWPCRSLARLCPSLGRSYRGRVRAQARQYHDLPRDTAQASYSGLLSQYTQVYCDTKPLAQPTCMSRYNQVYRDMPPTLPSLQYNTCIAIHHNSPCSHNTIQLSKTTMSQYNNCIVTQCPSPTACPNCTLLSRYNRCIVTLTKPFQPTTLQYN